MVLCTVPRVYLFSPGRSQRSSTILQSRQQYDFAYRPFGRFLPKGFLTWRRMVVVPSGEGWITKAGLFAVSGVLYTAESEQSVLDHERSDSRITTFFKGSWNFMIVLIGRCSYRNGTIFRDAIVVTGLPLHCSLGIGWV